jgi:hypothetical protein
MKEYTVTLNVKLEQSISAETEAEAKEKFWEELDLSYYIENDDELQIEVEYEH